MKIVVFGPERRVGVLQGERVVDLNAAAPSLPATLEAFIEAGGAGLEGARQALESVGAEEPSVHEVGSLELHAPCVYRPRVACAGGNYAVHLAGAMSARTGREVRPEDVYQEMRAGPPWGFWKVADVLGPRDDVAYPDRAELFDYEGELAVVFGKAARDVPADRVRDHVWGVTLLNDWSIRNDMGPNRVLSFNLPKNFDGSTSLGPSVVAGEDLDLQDIPVEVRVNGQVRQSYNTRDMIFSFAELVEYLSRDFTFRPGDVLAAGTGPGTAMDTTRPRPDGSTPPDRFLKIGDLVEVSSPQIGALRNRVVAKPT